jgi:predicted DNA-binding antitoxin AbrB/MazE fold protein
MEATSRSVEAVFEDGVFKPLGLLPAGLEEGQKVTVSVESEPTEDVLQLAAKVYEGLSDEEIDDVERVATDRRSFFGGD